MQWVKACGHKKHGIIKGRHLHGYSSSYFSSYTFYPLLSSFVSLILCLRIFLIFILYRFLLLFLCCMLPLFLSFFPCVFLLLYPMFCLFSFLLSELVFFPSLFHSLSFFFDYVAVLVATLLLLNSSTFSFTFSSVWSIIHSCINFPSCPYSNTFEQPTLKQEPRLDKKKSYQVLRNASTKPSRHAKK